MKSIALTDEEIKNVRLTLDAAARGYEIAKIANPAPPPKDIVDFYESLAVIDAKLVNAKPLMRVVES